MENKVTHVERLLDDVFRSHGRLILLLVVWLSIVRDKLISDLQRAAAFSAGSRCRFQVKSAMKSWLLRSAVRPLEVHMSRLPSGLKTGRPSKPS